MTILDWIYGIERPLSPLDVEASIAGARSTSIWRQTIPYKRNPDTRMVQLSRRDFLTLRDLWEGVQIFGGLGSGKTSGSGRAIAQALLTSGAGGLVLTVKTDEPELWRSYGRKTNRLNHMIFMGLGSEYRFNFLDYAYCPPGSEVTSSKEAVELLMKILEAPSDVATPREASFWRDAASEMIRNAIDLIALAQDRISVDAIRRVVQTAPTSLSQVNDNDWLEKSYTFKCLCKAKEHEADPRFLEYIKSYWFGEFLRLNNDTRTSITIHIETMLGEFNREPLYSMFCTDTNIIPEMCRSGAIIVMDLPVDSFRRAGVFAQIIMKSVWQKSVRSQKSTKEIRTQFLWADEAQNFIVPSDANFQTISRQYRAATVYLTQNMENYYSQSGSQAQSELIDSFIGLCGTQIFHSNQSKKTNEYASEKIGKGDIYEESGQTNIGANRGDPSGVFGGGTAVNKRLDYVVQPHEFIDLKKGGKKNRRIVEAYIVSSNGKFRVNDQYFLKVRFNQASK